MIKMGSQAQMEELWKKIVCGCGIFGIEVIIDRYECWNTLAVRRNTLGWD
jgi:hypothetical protein